MTEGRLRAAFIFRPQNPHFVKPEPSAEILQQHDVALLLSGMVEDHYPAVLSGRHPKRRLVQYREVPNQLC
jgi:hypothetical protein